MKYTLCITQRCNLACRYCYIGKKNAVMPFEVAMNIVRFMYENTPADEKIEVGFFGGEPLLEFDLISKITENIKENPRYDPNRVIISLVTNGTLFSREIARFIETNDITLCVSCDGPHYVQDVSRCYADGGGSSKNVTKNIRAFMKFVPYVLVNAVYGPETLKFLPETVVYLSSLGLKQIYINPDYTAPWTLRDVDRLKEVYSQVGDIYAKFQLAQDPHFISLIDSKIAVILRGGYNPQERCRMGRGEFGFAPSGNVYPCERLIGDDDKSNHCIGHLSALPQPQSFKQVPLAGNIDDECGECGFADYCMNWCGCSNYFSSGKYQKAGPFLCASEKASIMVAFNVFTKLENILGPIFLEHLAGRPHSFIANRSHV
ncbi:MAG: radical SAM protein [Methanosarcinaceae archaeon]|nr:radical SAM protein [Methanosarcinaceae archaeon]